MVNFLIKFSGADPLPSSKIIVDLAFNDSDYSFLEILIQFRSLWFGLSQQSCCSQQVICSHQILVLPCKIKVLYPF